MLRDLYSGFIHSVLHSFECLYLIVCIGIHVNFVLADHHHGTKQHKGSKPHAALSSSDQLLSRLVGSGISLGSATSPALHVTKTPTSSLMEALRAANLADNPTSFLVAADNSNNHPSAPFSNLNRAGVVVKSGGSSSVAQSSISAESVSQSPLTQTINTGGGNANEDAEMRVSVKGASLDVAGRSTSNRTHKQQVKAKVASQ